MGIPTAEFPNCILQVHQTVRAPMFNLLPYLWMAFMLAVILVPTIVGLMNRPKRQPKVKPTDGELVDGAVENPEPVLDFGDELAEIENK